MLPVIGWETASGAGAAKVPPLGQERVLDAEAVGSANPVGLGYSPRSGRLYVVDGDRKDALGLYGSALTGGKPARKTGYRLTVSDPANVAFDGRRSRLLVLTGPTGQLVEIRERQGGLTNTSKTSQIDAARFGLKSPRGITVDPATGTIYVLDANGPSLTVIRPGQGGSLYAATATNAALRRAGFGKVHGLAFDPATGNLYVGAGPRLVEITTTGVVVASHPLAPLDLSGVAALTFAPSGDRTDDPSHTNLYLAVAAGEKESSGSVLEVTVRGLATAASSIVRSTVVGVTDLSRLAPPSPDASGITYVESRTALVITDGEVEERVAGFTAFQDTNLWELSPGGSVLRVGNISGIGAGATRVSNEPTGIAWDSVRGRYYISDDDRQSVLTVDPGADGKLGTPDDGQVSRFITRGTGNFDPEGLAVDAEHGMLYVTDGVNREIYGYTVAGQPVGHFDVGGFGVADPEGIEFNPARGTLLVLSNRAHPAIMEFSTGGALLREYSLEGAGLIAPAGVTVAPASDGSKAPRFYVVDRGIDNNIRPGIVDSRLFELSAEGSATSLSQPPTVNAGPDVNLELPGSLVLEGKVADDGFPKPANLRISWAQVSGPGTVTLADARSARTKGNINLAGTYTLRLTVTDGEWTSTDDVLVVATGTGGIEGVDVPVATPADDAEEASTNGVSLTSTDLDLINDSSSTPPRTNLLVGLRFAGVRIPRGVRITNAYVQFQADEAHREPSLLTVRAQRDDDAGVFLKKRGNLSTRPATTAQVLWQVAPWLSVGEVAVAERTPNLAPVIQEVIDRVGWQPGNAMVVLLTGDPGSQRVARATDSKSKNVVPARLHIEWSQVPRNALPVVEITSPVPRDEPFHQGNKLVLTADATDLEDGNVSSNLVWASNRDGRLGKGARVTVRNLSVGTHVITATVTDTTGARRQVSVTIAIDAK